MILNKEEQWVPQYVVACGRASELGPFFVPNWWAGQTGGRDGGHPAFGVKQEVTRVADRHDRRLKSDRRSNRIVATGVQDLL